GGAAATRLRQEVCDCGPLRCVARRQHLEHETAPTRAEAVCTRVCLDLLELPSCSLAVGCGAVMECGRERLLLDRPRCARCKRPDPLPPRVGVRVELEAVLADVRQLGHADDRAGDLTGPAADA